MLYENGPAVSSERDKVMLMVARAYEGTGNPQRACYFYREAYYIGDSIHQLDVQQQVGDAAARYDAKEKQLKITQLQKNAAEAEVKQWRLGAALAGIVLLLFATIVAAIIWHRQQRRKAQLDQARRYIDGIESVSVWRRSYTMVCATTSLWLKCKCPPLLMSALLWRNCNRCVARYVKSLTNLCRPIRPLLRSIKRSQHWLISYRRLANSA